MKRIATHQCKLKTQTLLIVATHTFTTRKYLSLYVSAEKVTAFCANYKTGQTLLAICLRDFFADFKTPQYRLASSKAGQKLERAAMAKITARISGELRPSRKREPTNKFSYDDENDSRSGRKRGQPDSNTETEAEDLTAELSGSPTKSKRTKPGRKSKATTKICNRKRDVEQI